MLRLLGYPTVRNLICGWKEWGDRLELPIETCAAPDAQGGPSHGGH